MKYSKSLFFKAIILAAIVPFTFSNLTATAQITLPEPTQALQMGAVMTPPMVIGMRINPKDPFSFKFLVDMGESNLDEASERQEYEKLVKYFLTALTIPNDDMWVNLSPYEAEKIIPGNFALTEMGFELLAQDYILKQLSASMLNPNSEVGKEFWSKVNAKASEMYGTIDVPVNTFNKVWIVPAEASVFEKNDTVMVAGSKLKVMLEEDYLALEINKGNKRYKMDKVDEKQAKNINGFASDVLREVVIPALEEEVNTGEHFAPLRQAYQSIILAIWYKQALRESLLAKIYADQSKVLGVDNPESGVDNQDVYDQYLAAFDKGAFSFVKEDIDPATKKRIPRKYFSGGITVPKTVAILSGEGPAALSGPAEAMFRQAVVQGNVKEFDVSLAPRVAADYSMLSSNVTAEVVLDDLARADLGRKIEGAVGRITLNPTLRVVIDKGVQSSDVLKGVGNNASVEVDRYVTDAQNPDIVIAVGRTVGGEIGGQTVYIPASAAAANLSPDEVTRVARRAQPIRLSEPVRTTGRVALATSQSADPVFTPPISVMETSQVAELVTKNNPYMEEVQSKLRDQGMLVFVGNQQATLPQETVLTVLQQKIQTLDVGRAFAESVVETRNPGLRQESPEKFQQQVALFQSAAYFTPEMKEAQQNWIQGNLTDFRRQALFGEGAWVVSNFDQTINPEQMTPAEQATVGAVLDLAAAAREAGRPVVLTVSPQEHQAVQEAISRKFNQSYEAVTVKPQFLTAGPAAGVLLHQALTQAQAERMLEDTQGAGSLLSPVKRFLAGRVEGTSLASATVPMGVENVLAAVKNDMTRTIESIRDPGTMDALRDVATGVRTIDQLSPRETQLLQNNGLIGQWEGQTVMPPVVKDAFNDIAGARQAAQEIQQAAPIIVQMRKFQEPLANLADAAMLAQKVDTVSLSRLSQEELRNVVSATPDLRAAAASLPADAVLQVDVQTGDIAAVDTAGVRQVIGSVPAVVTEGMSSQQAQQTVDTKLAGLYALSAIGPGLAQERQIPLDQVFADIASGEISVQTPAVRAAVQGVMQTGGVSNERVAVDLIRSSAVVAAENLAGIKAEATPTINVLAGEITQRLVDLANEQRVSQGQLPLSPADGAMLSDIVQTLTVTTPVQEREMVVDVVERLIRANITSPVALDMAMLAPSGVLGDFESAVRGPVEEKIREAYSPAQATGSVFDGRWPGDGISDLGLYLQTMKQVSPDAASVVPMAYAVTRADHLDRNPALSSQRNDVLSNLVTTFRTQLKDSTLSPEQKKAFYEDALRALGRLSSYAGSPGELGALGNEAQTARMELTQIPEAVELARVSVPDRTGTRTANDTVGGIDLDAELFDLIVKKDGNGVPLPLSDQDADMLRFDGFVPVIKEIQKVQSLSILE